MVGCVRACWLSSEMRMITSSVGEGRVRCSIDRIDVSLYHSVRYKSGRNDNEFIMHLQLLSLNFLDFLLLPIHLRDVEDNLGSADLSFLFISQCHSRRGSGTDLQILETRKDRVHTRPDTGGIGLDVVFGNIFGDHGYKVLEPFLGLWVGWDDLLADELECLDVSNFL